MSAIPSTSFKQEIFECLNHNDCGWKGDLYELFGACPRCESVSAQVSPDGSEHFCADCKKTFMAETIYVPGRKTKGRLCCPVCGSWVLPEGK